MAEKNVSRNHLRGGGHSFDASEKSDELEGIVGAVTSHDRQVLRRAATLSSRFRETPNGLVRLTPTEMQILSFLERREGHPCSKAQIAAAIGRNEKTVDRPLSKLRRNEIVVSEPVYAESGAQLANVYRVVG